MQLFSADATIFSKIFWIFFCPQKVEKTTLKSCSEKLKSTFFPYCPELPKQKNSCSKMWLIDQLYIELGYVHTKQTRLLKVHNIDQLFTIVMLVSDVGSTWNSKLQILNCEFLVHEFVVIIVFSKAVEGLGTI